MGKKTVILTDEEIKFLGILAKWFGEGRQPVGREEAMEQLGADNKKFDTLVKTMQGIGAIERVSNADQCYAILIWPSAKAVQLLREIELEKQRQAVPPDIVEQLTRRVRQNPSTAWPIIVFLVLAVLITMLNNLLELVAKIVHFFQP